MQLMDSLLVGFIIIRKSSEPSSCFLLEVKMDSYRYRFNCSIEGNPFIFERLLIVGKLPKSLSQFMES